MAISSNLTKPFAAAYRARGYFIAGFVFWVMFHTISVPFHAIPEAQRVWWQDLIDKAVGSLDKISYLCFLAGLIYAVVSDVLEYVYNNSLKGEIEKGFRGTGQILEKSLNNFRTSLTSISYEAVRVWVNSGNGSPHEVRSIAETALIGFYGAQQTENDNIIKFVLEELLDGSAVQGSQLWENFSSTVTIRPCELKSHFEWEETRSYTLVCAAQSGTLPLRLEGTVQVEAGQVLSALDQMEFRIRYGANTIVLFSNWWASHRPHLIDDRFRIEADGITVEYDGIWLRYSFARDCDINQLQTNVQIYEKSYLSEEDRCYILAVRHPTKNIRAALTIEGLPNWLVKSPVASAKLYQKYSNAVQIETIRKQSCSANVPGWTLPGIALGIEWTPTSRG